MAILISQEVDIKRKTISRNQKDIIKRRRYYIIIKESTHQEEIKILNLNLYVPNKRTSRHEAKSGQTENKIRQIHN